MSQIIIDANVASEFREATEEARLIARWLTNRGKLSTGGRNLQELLQTRIRGYVEELRRAGRINRVNDDLIAVMEVKVLKNGIRSDDEHVIALALVGGARLLYSRDVALIRDFVDRHIISPRARCFRRADRHSHLLR